MTMILYTSYPRRSSAELLKTFANLDKSFGPGGAIWVDWIFHASIGVFQFLWAAQTLNILESILSQVLFLPVSKKLKPEKIRYQKTQGKAHFELRVLEST